jgi:hypothetical protein
MTSWTAAHRNIGYGRLGVIAALGSIGAAPVVAAQSSPPADPVRVQLTVEADARCATAASVAERVRSRSQRIEFIDDRADIPRLHVAIRGASTGDRVADLAVSWPDGRSSERRLTARSCAAAQDAIALLVAMTLDPTAVADAPARKPASPRPRPRPTPRPTPPSTPTPSPSPTPDPSPMPTPGPSDSADPRGTSDPPLQPDPSPRTPPSPRVPWEPVSNAPHPLGIDHFAAGAGAQFVSGPAPRAMPGLGLYARLSLHGEGAWAPAVALHLSRAWLSGVVEAAGEADFALDLAQLDACPLGLRLGPFAAHACANAALGRISASGSQTYLPQAQQALWASAGAAVLLALGLGETVELQGAFGGMGPLRRFGFAFRPDVFHRVPDLCLYGHFGVGLRFP